MNLKYSKNVNESLYKNSRIILNGRKDTSIETAMAIDSRIGKVITTSTTEENFKSAFNEKQKEAVSNNLNDLIIIHNHPRGGRLSYSDIHLLFKEDKYLSMFSIGHNGDVCGIKKNTNISIENIEKLYEEYYNTYRGSYDKMLTNQKATDKVYEYLEEKGCVIYGNY